MGALARAEEANAAHQRSISDAGGRKDDLLPRREIVRVVDLVWIGYSHRFQAFNHFFRSRHLVAIDAEPLGIENQSRLNLAVQTLDGRGSQDAFGRAADTDTCVDVGARDRGGNPGGKITVGDQANARARRWHVVNDFLVSLSIENDYCQ